MIWWCAWAVPVDWNSPKILWGMSPLPSILLPVDRVILWRCSWLISLPLCLKWLSFAQRTKSPSLTWLDGPERSGSTCLSVPCLHVLHSLYWLFSLYVFIINWNFSSMGMTSDSPSSRPEAPCRQGPHLFLLTSVYWAPRTISGYMTDAKYTFGNVWMPERAIQGSQIPMYSSSQYQSDPWHRG